MKLNQLKDDLERALTAARDIAEKAETEERDFTAEERAALTKAMDDVKALRAKFDEAKADDEMRSAIKALGDDIGLIEPIEKGDSTPAGKGSTIGEQFVTSPEFKALLGQFPGGRISEKARVQSAPVEFKSFFKALITGTSDTSAGALVQSDFRGILDTGTLMRPLTIRDLVTNGSTESDTIEYVRINSFTNNAAPVAEATTAAGADVNGDGTALELPAGSGIKPESSLGLLKVTETVKTIAHWIPATKRSLSDASQIRTIIDNFLRYGLEEELEDQMISGNGTGENFTGLSNVSGVQTQAWDTDLLTTTRKARTKVRTVGRTNPTAYVMNPADWETIDLLQDNEARYFFGGPQRLGQPTLWGLPVVESEAVPAGTGYVGDWRMAVLWDREQASITVSDSHSDFFVRNLVAILAELRAAFGVLRPKAFVEIDLTA